MNDPPFTYVWLHLSELLLENVLKGQYVDLGEEIQTQMHNIRGVITQTRIIDLFSN